MPKLSHKLNVTEHLAAIITALPFPPDHQITHGQIEDPQTLGWVSLGAGAPS